MHYVQVIINALEINIVVIMFVNLTVLVENAY